MDDSKEASAYAKADFSEVNQAFLDRLLALAGPRDMMRVADFGTGPGAIPLSLIQIRPDWKVTAIDGSEAMLRLAREASTGKRESRAIKWVLADATDTGLASQSFDVLFSNSLLHHLTDTDRFWAELKRLACPGAVVFFRDLARVVDKEAAWKIIEQYAKEESQLLKEEFFRSLLAAYTPDEIRAQLERAGLTTLEVKMASDRHLDIFGQMPR